MIFIYYKDFKTLKTTLFGALADQIQHMAAQKVRFKPRLLRQVALTCSFQDQLHWNLHSRAELETCKLGPPALGACKKYTYFGPKITPSGTKVTQARTRTMHVECGHTRIPLKDGARSVTLNCNVLKICSELVFRAASVESWRIQALKCLEEISSMY